MFLKKGIVQTRIMHFFLQVTLKLLKWPWIKIMTLPQMISNLHVKKELLMFLHKKDIDTNYAIFFLFKWLWTCSNDLGSKLLHTLRRYAILCEEGTSYVTLKERFGQTRIMHFSLQWPWTCPKDLWFNSWHALTLEVIIVW